MVPPEGKGGEKAAEAVAESCAGHLSMAKEKLARTGAGSQKRVTWETVFLLCGWLLLSPEPKGSVGMCIFPLCSSPPNLGHLSGKTMETVDVVAL